MGQSDTHAEPDSFYEGSVSSGTMLTSDLIPAFNCGCKATELIQSSDDYPNLANDILDIDQAWYGSGIRSAYNDLCDAASDNTTVEDHYGYFDAIHEQARHA